MVEVCVATLEGAVYKFPDMDLDALTTVLKDVNKDNVTSLLLVNKSGATLLIPWRIVGRVWVTGMKITERILWKRD